MYCNFCKKEVVAAGNMCPYCGNKFSPEGIKSEREAQAQAQAELTAEKSKAAALILNYFIWGIGGVAYLGYKSLAKERLRDWVASFLLCLTVAGIFFAIPRMCKLFITPLSDLKNIFSSKKPLINDKGEIIIWK